MVSYINIVKPHKADRFGKSLQVASFEREIPFRLFDLKNRVVYQIAEAGYAAFGWAEQLPTQWK